MASTFTPSIGLEKPARNDYRNTWDVPANANFDKIDDKFGGNKAVALSNANVTLTADQARTQILVFTGTITANIVVSFPAGTSGFYTIYNATAGAFNITIQILPGAGTSYVVPPWPVYIVVNGVDVIVPTAGEPPGVPKPWLSTYIPPNHVLLNGQALSRTGDAVLFRLWGTTFGVGDGTTTFNVPDLRGYTLAGLDTMGGIGPRNVLTSFGTSGTTLGATGGSQTHALITAELATHLHAVTDGGHAHAITDTGHVHNLGNNLQGGAHQAGGVNAPDMGAGPPGALFTTNSTTGIVIQSATTGITIQNTGSGTAHNNVQPTMLCNWIARRI